MLAGFPRQDIERVHLSSPAVVDIDADGGLDVLLGDNAGCVWAWRDDGSLLPNYPLMTSGSCAGVNRINGPLAIGDIDGDGYPDIVGGTQGASGAAGERGKIFVWQGSGALVAGWPQEMDWAATAQGLPEVQSVALNNMDSHRRYEVLAGTNNNSTNDTLTIPNLYVFYHDGARMNGFPAGYRSAGIWGQIATANVGEGPYPEVIAGRDQLYVHAYVTYGNQLAGWPVRTYFDSAFENYDTDPYLEFTHSAPAIGDIDHNGTLEVVIAGKLRDPLAGHVTTGAGVLVFEPDGQRHPAWQQPPLAGMPLHTIYEPNNPVALADFEDDGQLEIVVVFFDGTIRAYRANGTEIWAYDYAQGQTLFASEPAIGDVDGDGQPDIVFGTYSPDGSANGAVALHALNAMGGPLTGYPLALPAENSTIQGIRAAPTLADLDGDCSLEVIAGSLGRALYVWDTNVFSAPLTHYWPTGRHDLQRSGALPVPLPATAQPGLRASKAPFNVYIPAIQAGCAGV